MKHDLPLMLVLIGRSNLSFTGNTHSSIAGVSRPDALEMKLNEMKCQTGCCMLNSQPAFLPHTPERKMLSTKVLFKCN